MQKDFAVGKGKCSRCVRVVNIKYYNPVLTASWNCEALVSMLLLWRLWSVFFRHWWWKDADKIEKSIPSKLHSRIRANQGDDSFIRVLLLAWYLGWVSSRAIVCGQGWCLFPSWLRTCWWLRWTTGCLGYWESLTSDHQKAIIECKCWQTERVLHGNCTQAVSSSISNHWPKQWQT